MNSNPDDKPRNPVVVPPAVVARDLWPEDIAGVVMYHANGVASRYERFVAKLYHELSRDLTERQIALVFRKLGIKVQGITE